MTEKKSIKEWAPDDQPREKMMAKGKADSHIASSRSFGDIDFKMVIAMVKTGLTGVLFVVDTKDDERVIVIAERAKA